MGRLINIKKAVWHYIHLAVDSPLGHRSSEAMDSCLDSSIPMHIWGKTNRVQHITKWKHGAGRRMWDSRGSGKSQSGYDQSTLYTLWSSQRINISILKSKTISMCNHHFMHPPALCSREFCAQFQSLLKIPALNHRLIYTPFADAKLVLLYF